MAVLQRSVWLLTDFGRDYAVGRLHGAVRKVSPLLDAHDLDHTVPAQNTLVGAWRLLASIPSIPKDSVIVAVVDPHVGTGRKPVAVELKTGHILVGPADNGLLSAAIQLYGAERAHFIENSNLFNGDLLLEPRPSGNITPAPVQSLPSPLVQLVSSSTSSITRSVPTSTGFFQAVSGRHVEASELTHVTFHGLQIFGPVGAHLAFDTPLESVGSAARLDSITPLWLPFAATDKLATGCLTDIDPFGNLRTNLLLHLIRDIGLEFGAEYTVKFWSYYSVDREQWEGETSAGTKVPSHTLTVKLVKTFADASDGTVILLPGSCGGCLDIAVVNGNAFNKLNRTGTHNILDLLRLRPHGDYLLPVNEVTVEKRTNPEADKDA